jgi:SNF2 family DNA or RNA helicase
MLRQQQITSGFLRDTQGVDHPLGSSKLEVLLDLLEDRLDQKVVVSFLYAYERRAIEAALELAKRSHACIDGHTSDRARTGIVGAFQEGKIDVLLLQARAGGTSITLTRADCLIKFCQLSGVPDNTQLEGRIHRIGTTTHVQYIDLIVSGTIDEYLQQGLAAKMDQVSLASLLKRRMGL